MNKIRIIVKNDGTIGRVIIGTRDEIKNKELFYPINYGTYYESSLELLSNIKYKEGTEKEYIEYVEKEFSWGKVIKTHIIENYQIIENINKDNNEKNYHTYLNYIDTNKSYKSLEKAIVGGIVYNYDGMNSQADKFFWKMINK